jgi:hypothetical protein
MAMLIVSVTSSPLPPVADSVGLFMEGLCCPAPPSALLIGMPFIDDPPLFGGDAPPAAPKRPEDEDTGDRIGDGDLFLDAGDSDACKIESRVEFSACSAWTTSAKEMKLRRRGSVVSMAPYDEAASSVSNVASWDGNGDKTPLKAGL